MSNASIYVVAIPLFLAITSIAVAVLMAPEVRRRGLTPLSALLAVASAASYGLGLVFLDMAYVLFRVVVAS